jgi:hypothetical protein
MTSLLATPGTIPASKNQFSCLGLLLFLPLLGHNLLGQSQRAPAHRVVDENRPEIQSRIKTDLADRLLQDKQPQPASSPAAVAPAPAVSSATAQPASKCDALPQPDQRGYLRRAFVPETWPNWLLFWAGTFGVAFAYKPLRTVIRQNNTMKETAERQLRAYLFPELAASRRVTPAAHFIKIDIKNSGQTPAYEYQGYIAVGVFTPGQEPATLDLPPEEDFSRGSLGPGCKFELGGREYYMTPEQAADVARGAQSVYIYGNVDYRDAFGQLRFTSFRLCSTGEMFQMGRFEACLEGNEAN